MADEDEAKETSKVDAELWLEGMGLPAASMDPSSLNALSDLLSGQHVDFNDPNRLQQSISTAAEDSSLKQTTPNHGDDPIADSDFMYHRSLQHSGLGADDDRRVSPAEETQTSVAVPEEATAVERLILETLNQQTMLIKNLEKRLDNMQTAGQTSSSKSRRVDSDEQKHRVMDVAANAREALDRIQRQYPIPPPEAPRPRVVVHQRAPLHAGPPPQQGVTDGRGSSRVFKCIVLFLALRRQQVPNDRIDAWMLVKILFMLSILLSKDQSKLFTVMCVVIVGFLWQSGLAGFLYKFVVRYNYVGRILLHNEDITVASALAEQQQPIVQDRAGGDAQLQQQQRQWWLVDPERPAIYNLVMDVGMLFGSLILSIFPMWRVPDPPPPPPADEEEEEEERNFPERHDMIPVVRPPVDPAAADSDDEQDENLDNQ